MVLRLSILNIFGESIHSEPKLWNCTWFANRNQNTENKEEKLYWAAFEYFLKGNKLTIMNVKLLPMGILMVFRILKDWIIEYY